MVFFRQRRKQPLHLHLDVLPITRLCAHPRILRASPTASKTIGQRRILIRSGKLFLAASLSFTNATNPLEL